MGFEPVVTETGQFMYDNFHFSEASRCNGFLLCSGVVGTGPRGKLPEDLKEEFRNAWKGIGRLLAECNLGYQDIVEYTSYHVGLQATARDFMEVRVM